MKSKKKDAHFEIKFYEGLLKKKTNFVEALSALGDLYTQEGFYAEGLAVDKKLAYLKPDDPIVLYNLACSYSLMDNIDDALKIIKKAISCGYDDFIHLQKDGDLLNLRNDNRFRRYFKKITGKKMSTHKE